VVWESQANIPVGELINDLSQAYIFETVADMQASTIVFPVGKTIHLNDRGADFTVISGTLTGNGKDIIASDNVNQSLRLVNLGGIANIEHFGAVGDAVQGNTITPSSGTDNTAIIQRALDTGLNVFITKGNFAANQLTMSPNQTIYGDGINSRILTTSTSVALDVRKNCKVLNFTIGALETDTVFIHPNDDFDDPQRNFEYKDLVVGVGQTIKNQDEVTVDGMYIEKMWRGIGINNCKNITVTNNIIKWVGVWQAQFYIVDRLIFNSNQCLYGGNDGGIAASSATNAVFSNNIVIGSGTGINTGGSTDPAFNAENIVVTGNQVLARDCINCENGIFGATISGNSVTVFENKDLVGTTGVGIACTSDSTGGAAGLISNINITGNTIKAYSRNVAYGIRVSTAATNYPYDFEDVLVTSNDITGANFGVNIGSETTTVKVNSVNVNSNKVKNSVKGVFVFNAFGVNVANNNLEQGGSAPLGGFIGVQFADVDYAELIGNQVRGFGEAYNLDANCSTIRIMENFILPHRVSVTNGSTLITATDSYFYVNQESTVTDTGNRLIVNSNFINYSPATSTIIAGLIGGLVIGGQFISIKFNGNVQLNGSAGLTLLSSNYVPPAGGVVLFVAKIDGRLQEVSRSFN